MDVVSCPCCASVVHLADSSVLSRLCSFHLESELFMVVPTIGKPSMFCLQAELNHCERRSLLTVVQTPLSYLSLTACRVNHVA